MKLNDYIRGRRKGSEARRIELEALGDPFLRDALEGYDLVEGDHAEALGRLSERISMRARQDRRPGRRPVSVWRRASVWGSAAALILCVALSGLVLDMLQNDMFDKALAIYDLTVPVPEPMRVEEDIPLPPEAAPAASPPPTPSVSAMQDKISIYSDEPSLMFDFGDFDDQADMVILETTHAARSASASTADLAARTGTARSVKERMVRGRVVDEHGRPVAGATVVTDSRKVAVSGPEGEFQIEVEGDEPGLYASSPGYEAGMVGSIQGSTSSPVVIPLRRSEEAAGNTAVGERAAVAVALPGGSDELAGAAAEPPVSVTGMAAGSPSAGRWKPAGAGAGAGMVAVGASPSAPIPLTVGRGSYDALTRAIATGALPEATAVRTEELVNRFTYDRPLPSGRDALRITCEVGPCPWNGDNKLIMITLRTKAGREPDEVAAAVAAAARFEPRAVSSYRLVGYETVPVEGYAGVDMYAGEEITVMYEVVPAGGNSGLMATVEAVYGRPGTRRTASVAAEARDRGAEPSPDFHFASAVALFGELLRGSPVTGSAGFEDVVALARMGVRSDSDNVRMEFVRIAQKARELAEQGGLP
ncbi:MAG: von Willebrand factor type A domain-containing protein [Alistipes sp.]|nr:von Willebrand factor type A domain-containing protein [Alistipes sp.]